MPGAGSGSHAGELDEVHGGGAGVASPAAGAAGSRSQGRAGCEPEGSACHGQDRHVDQVAAWCQGLP